MFRLFFSTGSDKTADAILFRKQHELHEDSLASLCTWVQHDCAPQRCLPGQVTSLPACTPLTYACISCTACTPLTALFSLLPAALSLLPACTPPIACLHPSHRLLASLSPPATLAPTAYIPLMFSQGAKQHSHPAHCQIAHLSLLPAPLSVPAQSRRKRDPSRLLRCRRCVYCAPVSYCPCLSYTMLSLLYPCLLLAPLSSSHMILHSYLKSELLCPLAASRTG
jgi:hypothetical protein